MPPDTLQPATYQDIISVLATEHKIPPELALAVAQKESGFNPAAKSPKGAIGLMQLMPDTAKELGVDPTDPVQNITGGVKYLRQLSDRYNGDVQKMLWAYNGGMGRVDAGTIPPESQAYAADILASLSQQRRESAPIQPTPAHEPDKPSFMRQLANGVDPRNSEGRRNLASIAGAAGLTALTEGVGFPALATAVAGAALGGGGAEMLEQAAGTKPQDNAAVAQAAGTSAAYEVGGTVLMWPVKRLTRVAAATKVGRAAVEALGRNKEAAQAAGSQLVRSTRAAGSDAMASTREATRVAVEDMKNFGRDLVRQVRATGTSQVAKAEGLAASHVTQTQTQTAAALAKAELEAADAVTAAAKPIEAIRPPSVTRTGAAAKDVFAGLPGLTGLGEGPAKKALDMAGQRVFDAVQTGPAVQTAPIKAALDAMAARTRPDVLFPDAAPARGIGFMSNVHGSVRAAAASTGGATANEQSKLTLAISKALNLPETHPLPGVLAKIQTAPESLTFAESHQLKRLLDEAVNFDRTAKKHLEGMTKGIRSVLREQMTGHAPYDEATAAYAALVPLYRKGVGAQLIRAAATTPDSVAKILRPDSPAAAQAVKDLLLAQSEAGGDAATGQRAWDAVRANFTHSKLLAGGAEGLTDRITKLETQSPEFVSTVYGDPTAQQILANLKRLGQAYDTAVTQSAEKVAVAKTAGKTALETAKGTADTMVAGAKGAADTALETTREQARADLLATRRSGRAVTEQQRTANAKALTGALQTSAAGKQTVKEDIRRFGKSSLQQFTSPTVIENELADAVRLGLVGPGAKWGILSGIRLLSRNASRGDLLEWAAYSNRNMGLVTKLLMGQLPDRAASMVLREMGAALTPPVASHASTQP